MDEETKVQAAEKQPEGDKDKLLKKQETQIQQLTKELDALKKQLEDSQAAHRAMERKAKVEQLLSQWEEAGQEFETDEGRTAEIERLMKMSEEAFDATQQTVKTFAAGKKKKKDEGKDPVDDEPEDDPAETEDLDPKKTKKKPSKKGRQSTDAMERRTHVSDMAGGSLADKLTVGFMNAYKDRAGIDA